MSSITRFISIDEMHYVKNMFDHHPDMMGMPMTPEQVDNFVNSTYQRIKDGIGHVAMVFNGTAPIAMCVGIEFPMIAGWHKSLSKIAVNTNHYAITARMMASAEDLLIEKMENNGYYKFWTHSPIRIQNIRQRYLKKYSSKYARYDYVDEGIIPTNNRTLVGLYDIHRSVNNYTDVISRMYYLRQEYRQELITKFNTNPNNFRNPNEVMTYTNGFLRPRIVAK